MTDLRTERAPSGDEAFSMILAMWLAERDIRSFLHPAVQKALDDPYKGEHRAERAPADAKPLRFETMLLGSAFYQNYDKYYMLLWNQNLGAREEISAEFPQAPLEGGLPDLTTLPQDLQDQVKRGRPLPRGPAGDLAQAHR